MHVHWRNLKIFFYRIPGLIETKLGTTHPLVKGYSNLFKQIKETRYWRFKPILLDNYTVHQNLHADALSLELAALANTTLKQARVSSHVYILNSNFRNQCYMCILLLYLVNLQFPINVEHQNFHTFLTMYILCVYILISYKIGAFLYESLVNLHFFIIFSLLPLIHPWTIKKWPILTGSWFVG